MCRSAWMFCIYQMRRFFTKSHIVLLLMLLSVYAVLFAFTVSDYAAGYGMKVSALGLFPALNGDRYAFMVLMMGVVLLFSNAPFLDHNQMYLLLRSNRNAWALGQVLYIALLSAIYILLVLLVSWLYMLPNIEFSLEWGKIWKTLAFAPSDVSQIVMNVRVIDQHTVLHAFGMSLLLTWMACCILGALIFSINLLTHSRLGLIPAALLSVFDMTIANSGMNKGFYKASPVSLASLSVVDRSGMAIGYPSECFAFIVLLLILLLFVIAICWMVRSCPRLLERGE